MPVHGYGGGEAKGRRRERDESSDSRDRHRNKRKREAPGEKERDRKDVKKDAKKDRRDKDRRREEERPPIESPADDRRKRQDRDRGDGHRREEPGSGRKAPTLMPPPPPGEPARKVAKEAKEAKEDGQPQKGSVQKAKEDRKSWRQEVADDEDERDLSTDEEARDKKLEEARKRRQEIMKAKMADKKSEDPAPSDKQDAPAKGKPIEGSGAPGRGEADEAKRIKDEVGKAAVETKKQQEGMGDMFDERAEAADELKKAMRQSAAIGLTGASGDDWDDEEGYYIPKIGEVMGDRYLVVETSGGRGVFSNVVKAKDQQAEGEHAGQIVAVKILRANDMMTKAAEQEVSILERLNAADKKDKHHIIRLLATFAYRRHFCLVFEGMQDDLRAAVKKYTKNKGMSLQGVRAYTQQLIVGLGHMHKLQIIHADIKPDNILIAKGHQIVKFCDLGTAVQFKDINVSPYLASRFYRAPEVILGVMYDEQVDTWALACTLFEIFTGKTLLQSKTNNDHLRKIMELKGKIPGKVIKKGAVWKNHFTDDLDFKHLVDDPGSGQQVAKIITDLNASRSIKELVMERVGKEKQQSETPEDQAYCKRAAQFADLLEKMTALDPANRIRPDDALQHPFLQDTPAEKKAAEAAARQAAKERQDAARSGRPAR